MLSFIANTRTGDLTIVLNGQLYTACNTDINYKLVIDAIRNKDEVELAALLGLKNFEKNVAYLLDNGTVIINGHVAPPTLQKKILEFRDLGLPFDPLLRFIENCEQNPNPTSIEELYEFLENQNIPITEDGCFLAYKAIRMDDLDIYSGTILNKVGTTVSYPREAVDSNRNNTCSTGLHVAAMEYAQWYGGSAAHKIALCKVNPRNVVSVPRDHNAQKLRTCEYDVLSIITTELKQSDVKFEANCEQSNFEFRDCSSFCCCDIEDLDSNEAASRDTDCFENVSERLSMMYNRDMAVQMCKDNGLIEKIEDGRRLGKTECLRMLWDNGFVD